MANINSEAIVTLLSLAQSAAQTSSLPYRGFPTRRPDNPLPRSRLEVGDTADWKSALQ
jgi:hypothetical protein